MFIYVSVGPQSLEEAVFICMFQKIDCEHVRMTQLMRLCVKMVAGLHYSDKEVCPLPSFEGDGLPSTNL